MTLTADERPVFAATGSYYGGSCGEPLIAAAWTLELIEVTAFTSEWRLTADFMPPGGAPGYPELTCPAAGGFDGALGVWGISSMYADPQNFDADLFVANGDVAGGIPAASLVGPQWTAVDGPASAISPPDGSIALLRDVSMHNTYAPELTCVLQAMDWSG